MALPKTSLGACIIAGGFALLVATFFLPLEGRWMIVLSITGQVAPIVGLSYMQKDAKRFGKTHAARVGAAVLLGVVAILVTRFILRGIVKRHDISADAFDGLLVQAGADAFVAGVAILGLWTLSTATERRLLVGGGLGVLAASVISLLAAKLSFQGSDAEAAVMASLLLLVAGYVALAAAAGVFARRHSKEPERPGATPFVLG